MTTPLVSCPPAIPDNPSAATVNDMVAALTLLEVTELSNLDSGGSFIDCDRINMALQDAYNLLMAYAEGASPSASRIIAANLRRWMIIIARYYLDSIRRRQDVADDYKLVMNSVTEVLTAGGINSVYSDIWIERSSETWPQVTANW